MPEWEEVQGYASQHNERVVIRTRKPSTSSAGFTYLYFYQTSAEGLAKYLDDVRRETSTGTTSRGGNELKFRRNEINYYFARISSHRDSRVYNYILDGKSWGWFRNDSEWLSYKTIKESHWTALKHSSRAIPHPFNADSYWVNPYTYTGNKGSPTVPRGPLDHTPRQTRLAQLIQAPKRPTPDRVVVKREPAATSPETVDCAGYPSPTRELLAEAVTVLSSPEFQDIPQESSPVEEEQHLASHTSAVIHPDTTVTAPLRQVPLASQASQTEVVRQPTTQLPSTQRLAIPNPPTTREAQLPSPIYTASPMLRGQFLLQQSDQEPTPGTSSSYLNSLAASMQAPMASRRQTFEEDEDLESFRAQASTSHNTAANSVTHEQPTTRTRPTRSLLDEEEDEDTNFTATRDARVQKAGRLCAEIRNLENAYKRGYLSLLDQRPTVIPGRHIQTPHPELITDELVDSLNEAITKCALKCSKILLDAQEKAIKQLRAERADLLRTWNPSPAEEAEVRRIKEGRTTPEQPYVKSTLPEGPLRFFTPPDRNRGERFIGANRAVGSFLATGYRPPGHRVRFDEGRDMDDRSERQRDSPPRWNRRARSQPRTRNRNNSGQSGQSGYDSDYGRRNTTRVPRRQEDYESDHGRNPGRSNGYDSDYGRRRNNGYESDGSGRNRYWNSGPKN